MNGMQEQEGGILPSSDQAQVQPQATVEFVPISYSPSVPRHARSVSPVPKPCPKQSLPLLSPQPVPRKRWRREKLPSPENPNCTYSASSSNTLPLTSSDRPNGADVYDMRSQSLSPCELVPHQCPIPLVRERIKNVITETPTTPKTGNPLPALKGGPTPQGDGGMMTSALPPQDFPALSSPSTPPHGCKLMYPKATPTSGIPTPSPAPRRGSNHSVLQHKENIQEVPNPSPPHRSNVPDEWGATIKTGAPLTPPLQLRSSTLPTNKSLEDQDSPLSDGLGDFGSIPEALPAVVNDSIKFLPAHHESALSVRDSKEKEKEKDMHISVTLTKVHDGSDILLVPRQHDVSKASSDDDKEEERYSSAPLRKFASIHQHSSKTVATDHEDDIIWGTLPSQKTLPDPDYINQLNIDCEMEDLSSGDEMEESSKPLGSGAKRVIVTQRSTCIQSEDDYFEDEDVLKMTIHSKKEDYINQAEIDKIDVMSPKEQKLAHLSDYMSQDTAGRVGVGVSNAHHDYINQESIGQGRKDSSTEESFWKSIDSMSRPKPVQAHSEFGEKRKVINDGPYMNQGAIDATLEEIEGDPILKFEFKGEKRMDKYDQPYMNQGAIDATLKEIEEDPVLKFEFKGGKRKGKDDQPYINQGVIDATLGQTTAKDPYLKSELKGEKKKVEDGGAYMNQGVIDVTMRGIEKDFNFISQFGEEKRKVESDRSYMNQGVIDATLGHIIVKDPTFMSEFGEKRKAEDDKGYMNQGVIDATLKEMAAEEPYFTEDDFTTDDDDDDDEKNSTFKKIRATSVKSVNSGDKDKEYINQDILDGDIIPMMLVPSTDSMSSREEDIHVNHNVDTSQSRLLGDRVVIQQVAPHVPAETMSSAGSSSRSMASSTESAEQTNVLVRSPRCSEYPSEESTLDFMCLRSSGKSPSSLLPESSSPVMRTFANRSPQSMKSRSRMSVNVIDSRTISPIMDMSGRRSVSPRGGDVKPDLSASTHNPLQRDSVVVSGVEGEGWGGGVL